MSLQTPMRAFLLDAWYVACSSDELGDKPLGRTICNARMVFFRNAAGSVAALEDFCPHRGAPLSLGFVRAGRLVCGYHGLEMEGSGTVAAMPQQRVRGFPALRTYPTLERNGFVWVWPGDASKADPAALIAPAWADDPSWALGSGLAHIACDYRLMIDNLMDLTHETYVHAGSIGQREIDEAPCTTRVEGDEVITSRLMNGIQAPPFLQMAMRLKGLDGDALVDRWQICHFTPPSNVIIEVGVALAGHGGHAAPADVKVEMQVVDFITPETDQSIWYFWGMARHFKADDPALTARLREAQSRIFAEDKVVLERQQANLNAYPERSMLHLNIDTGGVQARKVIERRLVEEAGADGLRPRRPPASP